jgi:decaprenylphospho-beta-D-ribofuranose 2-oxidase
VAHNQELVGLSGWGRFPRARCRVERPENVADINFENEPSVIARGAGRSYGDAALSSDGLVLFTEKLNRQHTFDEKTGLLTAEAGTTIAEILDAFVPLGWFPPVTPGTKFVTLGGCVAADVHGKNHYRAGTFGAHVDQLELILADGKTIHCSPTTNPDLFHATVGGMGLTGVITTVSFRLRRVESDRMVVQHQPAKDLAAAMALLENAAHADEYAVCWIDSLAKRDTGRGIVISGNHAALASLPTESAVVKSSKKPPKRFTVPFNLPSSLLNPLTAGLFNRVYFQKQAFKRDPFLADLDSFFYPLDAINDWNRLYGRRGFVQYQFVLPISEALEGLRKILETTALSRVPSFLAVLKRFGAEGPGLLSFPLEGYSLSLDFPVSARLFELLRVLDEIVAKRGGRVYLAKDSCLDALTFRRMYPRFAEWQTIKKSYDHDNRFGSDLSVRLDIAAINRASN